MKRSPPESDWPQAGVCCPCCVCFNLKTRFAFPMAPPKSGFSFHLHSPMKEEVRPPSSPPFGANQTSVKFIPVLLLVPLSASQFTLIYSLCSRLALQDFQVAPALAKAFPACQWLSFTTSRHLYWLSSLQAISSASNSPISPLRGE